MPSSDIPKERIRQRNPNPLEAWHMQDEVWNQETNLEMDENKGLLKDYDNGLYEPDHKILLKKDFNNILLLLFLYVLQGIPLGVAGSIPLILQSKNVSYSDQAIYSFVFWPFSLKLLWAPLVDAAYFPNFGRRKSWLVPTQYLLGLFMLCLSFEVDALLKSDEHTSPNIVKLTVVFFMFGFLAATQDIAVDGWALTMLSKENVGLASTCNSVGQTAGYFLGNVLFLALESAEFCNKYLRSHSQPTGIVTLSDFLFFWGIIFMVTTTLVMVLKKENLGQTALHDVAQQGIMETYKSLICIIKMPAVLNFCIMLLTSKIGFSAADGVTGLKLVELGVPKEQLALLAVPMVPLQILLPFVISKYTAGRKPLSVFYWAMPYRLVMGMIFALLVFWTPTVKQGTEFPAYYYGVLLFSYALHQLCAKSGGSCSIATDGYYVESIFCIFIGLAWWLRYGNKFRNLQDEHPSTWECKRNN
uniref:acetyl-coenzyme A transporter 1 isoform X2 n=1 Tax=Pristiophorus japonicus TaxID=55135 RepID=UPI00398F470A